MKYMNVKNGVIVDSIEEVKEIGCSAYDTCAKCPLDRMCRDENIDTCCEVAEKHPKIICALFGYKPIGDDDRTTDEAASPGVGMVNRPSHYTMGGIECIDAIEAAIGHHEDPVEAFLTGQVMKYIWRWPHKANPLEDLKKARWYLERLIAHREKKETSDGQ